MAVAAARGDQRAFDTLVERYRGYIYTIAYRVTLHEDDALDVSQNVLLKLVERIGAFSATGSFKGWLGAIAANEAVSFVRNRARIESRRAEFDEQQIEQLPSAAPDLRDELERADRQRRVERAMKALSPQQRAIFALRFKSEMKPMQIAEELQLTSSQVRSQMVRATVKIRRTLFGNEAGMENNNATR